MRFGHLQMAVTDGVATVTFDRPPVNAVDLEVIEEFLAVGADLAADDRVRAVVLTGSERSFCAGADIAMMRDLSAEHHRRVRRWIEVQSALETMPKPVIAAIRGYALGGGLELALACDVRFAGRGATLGFPEIRLGIFPGAAGTQRLSRLLGPSRALRLLMDGTRLGAEEAARLGLVDEVHPDGLALPAALDYARTLAQGPTRALGLLKRCVYGGWGRPLPEGLQVEEEAVFEVITTRDAAEGMQAFMDKRDARFTGT